MARGPERSFQAALIALGLVLTGCQPGTAGPAVPTTVSPPTTASTTAPSTTTPPTTATTSTTTLDTTTIPDTGGVRELAGATVTVPDGDGPFPTVVLVHGGGWIVGSPESMSSLAEYLTGEGFITVNTRYQLSLRQPGFPAAVEDVSCAVAFAATHPLATGDVTLIGHSAGAHISSLVALDAAPYDDGCDVADVGSPNRFIGLAGPYDVTRIGPLLVPFFGVAAEVDPDLWDTGNPFNLVDRNPGLEVLLIHGDADPVVPPDFSETFADMLGSAGVSVDLEILPGVDHPGARSPAVVGELIRDWILG